MIIVLIMWTINLLQSIVTSSYQALFRNVILSDGINVNLLLFTNPNPCVTVYNYIPVSVLSGKQDLYIDVLHRPK